MNQRYVMDVKDFLLVEILLCILLIVLTKGIFEVKLSKLQFAIGQTESAAKYLNFTKEDFVRRNAFFNKRFSFASGKSMLKKSTLPCDGDKTVQRSAMSNTGIQTTSTALSNMSSVMFNSNSKSTPDYKNYSSYLNSSASDSCGSIGNSSPDSSLKRSVEATETKKIVHLPNDSSHSKQDLGKLTAVNIAAHRNKSQTCVEKDKVISTGTFTVRSNMAMNSEQHSLIPSKTSKSVAQGLNSTGNSDLQHVPGPSTRPNTPNIIKSLSQALTPPTNSPKLTPIKALRTAMRSPPPDKAFKSKSQDLWASHLKR